MTKRYKPREINNEDNPFIDSLVISAVKVDKETNFDELHKAGIIDDTIVNLLGGGFITKKSIVKETDRQATLYFSNNKNSTVHAFNKISSGALRMFIWITQQMRPNRTYVFFNREVFMSEFEMKSQTTFISQKKELIYAKLIAENAAFGGWIWINPAYAYYGDRQYEFMNKVDLTITGKISESDKLIEKKKKSDKDE